MLMLQEVPTMESPIAFSMTFVIVWLAIMILVIGGMWMTYQKAGHPGWAAIVPIYNIVILMRIAGRPGWWVLLCLIPIVNIVIIFIVSIDIARNFAKGTGFGIGLALLSPVFYPILGYGDARYQPAG